MAVYFKLRLRFFEVFYAVVQIAEKLFDFGDYGSLFGERYYWKWLFPNNILTYIRLRSTDTRLN
jgi:hypothetical protein